MDTNGEVSWKEFVTMVPDLLASLYATQEETAMTGQHDWCTFVQEDGTLSYYNKRTEESVWEKPMEMVRPSSPPSFNDAE